jgi:hypothetical protein
VREDTSRLSCLSIVALIRRGQTMQLEQYIAAQIVRHRTRRGFSTLFADFQEIQMREVVLQHPKSDEHIENEKKQAHQLQN